MLSVTEILSALIAKRLGVEQGRFLKRQHRVSICMFQRNCFILILRVATHEFNLELQFSKTFGLATRAFKF